MNNEITLLNQAKNGDDSAYEELLSSYKYLVTSISRRYFLTGGQTDDLLQEGMIGLFKAIKSFDSTKSDSFKAYAKTLIERQMINAIKSDNSYKHVPLNNSIALNSQGAIQTKDDNLVFLGNKTFDPERLVTNEHDVNNILKQIKQRLSELEYQVLTLYLEGRSYSDISQTLSINYKSVDNALNRIKSKLLFLKTK